MFVIFLVSADTTKFYETPFLIPLFVVTGNLAAVVLSTVVQLSFFFAVKVV